LSGFRMFTEDKHSQDLGCFKAYDIRGRVPDALNEDIAYRIGRAYAEFLRPAKIVVGRDVRLSSASLANALVRGLTHGSSDVFDIGVCGTEEVYFATFHERLDGGIMVTASHNPMDYNGMKLVREDARPISGDTGLNDVKELVRANFLAPVERIGSIVPLNIEDAYLSHLLGYVDVSALRPLKVVVNSGNGCAGRVIDLIEKSLPVLLVKVNHQADGSFPNGVPNPLLPENRATTIAAIRASRADIGVAWDGDFDRCFFFDEQGRFIEGYYLVGLIAQALLGDHPGAAIIHDPRLTWNTREMVAEAGGRPLMSKTGHAFIKERMRLENAVYGGEMSGHHYFRDFAYCDSGMIPWLLVLEMLCRGGKPLSDLLAERQRRFPVSGEINRRVKDPDGVLARVEEAFKPGAMSVDYTDGVSFEFHEWRFNLRKSNTEPALRLNVESRGKQPLLDEMTEKILAMMK
jgi:phosphomannomutase